jgi:hypothetical protein
VIGFGAVPFVLALFLPAARRPAPAEPELVG